MLVIFTIIVMTLLAMAAASLRPIYAKTPLKELKRRAHKGVQEASVFYQVARHGLTADLLLLAISIITGSAAFVLIATTLPSFPAVILIAVLIFVIFTLVPRRVFKISHNLALKTSPFLAPLLIKIRPFTRLLAKTVRRQKPVTVYTGIYEKADLRELLRRQKDAPQNRIKPVALERAGQVIGFDDKKISDCMVPAKEVHFVQSEDPIGPILLTELYDSGHTQFPVRNHEKAVVGTLFLKDLVDKRVSGIVSNVMSPAVFYVNGESPLEQVLAAFVKTKHYLFIVLDNASEVTGVITIEDVLRQLAGEINMDDLGNFDDLQEWAKQAAHKDSGKDSKK